MFIVSPDYSPSGARRSDLALMRLSPQGCLGDDNFMHTYLAYAELVKEVFLAHRKILKLVEWSKDIVSFTSHKYILEEDVVMYDNIEKMLATMIGLSSAHATLPLTRSVGGGSPCATAPWLTRPTWRLPLKLPTGSLTPKTRACGSARQTPL
eukprot:5059957-Amphidinium_carterae.2